MAAWYFGIFRKQEIFTDLSGNFPDVAADITNCLSQTLLVLDKGNAHIVFAVFAERPARRNYDIRIFDQVYREIDAALALGMFLRHFRPHEH